MVPPWLIGAVELTGHVADEVLGLGDPQGLPELLVGRVGAAVPEVAGDRAGEQERLLRHQADPAPEQSGSQSRTSTPSTRTDPPVASKSRGISEIRVVLPEPVEPMIAVVWPGSAVKVMSRSTGESARVGELGVLGSYERRWPTAR